MSASDATTYTPRPVVSIPGLEPCASLQPLAASQSTASVASVFTPSFRQASSA
jgi:hypothetical protein